MKNMLSDALREIRGLWNQLMVNLEGEQGTEWLAEFKKFLRKEKCWTEVVIKTIFDFVNTVAIPARTGDFVAKDHFVIDTSKKARAKISYLGDNFKENFFDKVEEPIVETQLNYHKLLKDSLDKQILIELGGKEKAEATLAEMFFLMEKQGNGQRGVLLINGYANIFYIRDSVGVLWAVACDWDGGGWDVGADSVERPRRWSAGHRVFSRNSP